MNVLSLFDGMSCGRIALERLWLKPTKYYASELDKYAMTVSGENYPDIVQLGDVCNWREWDIDWSSIDLLIGGSPCQGFSFAGKQLAFDDPRSKLFFVYVDILNHIKSVNPDVKFMLENVKMKREFLDVITKQLGVEPVFINSALVSAQNRQRYYWCNWNVEQPVDRGIMLVDILEDEPFDKTIMSDTFTTRNKSVGCLRDDLSGKAKSLSAMEYVKNGRQGDYIRCDFKHAASIVGRRLNHRGVREDYNKEVSITQCLQVKHDSSKMQCLTTVQKDTVVASLPPGRYANSEEYKGKYRKLTPIEGERLQGVDDNYTNHVSNTQRYKMLGNGWNVDTIVEILRQGL